MRALRPTAIVYHVSVLTLLAFLVASVFVVSQLRSACAMPPTFGEFFFDMFKAALLFCSPVLVVVAVKWWLYRRSEGSSIRAHGWLYLALVLGCSLVFAAVTLAPYDGFDGYKEWYAHLDNIC